MSTGVADSDPEEGVRRGQIALGRKVMVYFSDLEPIPSTADKQQLEQSWSFRQETPAERPVFGDLPLVTSFAGEFASHSRSR